MKTISSHLQNEHLQNDRAAADPSNQLVLATATPLEAALEYASRGWRVLPLYWPTEHGCACGKRDCDKAGKHPIPRNGVDAATTNPDVIRNWFIEAPNANVGIATGQESNLVVVDVDDSEASRHLFAQHGYSPETMRVQTGRAFHLYYLYPQKPVRNSAGKIAHGIDLRSDGGYVVAPPSLHATGQRYVTIYPGPISEMPDWLLALALHGRQTATAALSVPTTAVPVLEGSRNGSLFRLACRLRGREGMERQDLLRILSVYNDVNCIPPLDGGEVLRIVDSACKYPAEAEPKKSLRRQNENPLWWMKFNVRNWFSDENLNAMEDFQLGMHMRLLVFAWNRGGFLTTDVDKLWRLAKAKSKAVFVKHKDLVLSGFREVYGLDGKSVLLHETMAHEYAVTLKKWMQKVFNGEKNTDLALEP